MSKIYVVYEQDYDSPPEFVKAFRTKAKAGAFCRKANREVTCPDCKGTLVSGRYDRDTQLISTVGMNDPPGSGFRLAKKGDPIPCGRCFLKGKVSLHEYAYDEVDL